MDTRSTLESVRQDTASANPSQDLKFVYTTARGTLGVITAPDPHTAWRRIRARGRRPRVLLNEKGEAWVESSRGGAIRDSGADVNAGHVAQLRAQAMGGAQ